MDKSRVFYEIHTYRNYINVGKVFQSSPLKQRIEILTIIIIMLLLLIRLTSDLFLLNEK